MGVGGQIDFPAFLGASVRLWVQDDFGVEGVVGQLFGFTVIAVRGLIKLVNNPVADLYLAGGSSFAEGALVNAHAALGIEYSFSYAVALNAEIGAVYYLLTPGTTTVFGTGIHFYF